MQGPFRGVHMIVNRERSRCLPVTIVPCATLAKGMSLLHDWNGLTVKISLGTRINRMVAELVMFLKLLLFFVDPEVEASAWMA
jgi:hypothetical protein